MKNTIFTIFILALFIISGCQPLIIAPGYICNEDNVNVVLVLDTSGTMYGTKLTMAKDAMTSFASTLLANPNNKISVVTFGNNATTKSQLTNGLETIKVAINSITLASGRTCIGCGLNAAMLNLPVSTTSKNIIVLLSDGAPNECNKECDTTLCGDFPSTATPCTNYALDKARLVASQRSAKIYTIGVGITGYTEALLKDIATIGNGEAFNIVEMDGAVEVYNKIVNQVCKNECDITSPTYCVKGSRQCTNQDVMECVDSDADNCGDSYNKVTSCSGNFQCINGGCSCKSTIFCSNGKSNGDRWCDGLSIKKCTTSTSTCASSIITEASCVSPQSCDTTSGTPQCKCLSDCTVGDKRYPSSLGGTYDECVASSPCNKYESRTCPYGREYDTYTKNCECKASLNQCNNVNLQNTYRCTDLNTRQLCTKVANSELKGQSCWEFKAADTNQYPNTRECIGGDYVCKLDICAHDECSGDGQLIRECVTGLDTRCPSLSSFKNCPTDYKCSSTTWKCEPQHSCNPNDENNGKYMRCNPSLNSEIQECKKGVDGVFRWTTMQSLSCGLGYVCTTGSNAFCTLAYSVDIISKDNYGVGSPVSDVQIKLSSNELDIANIVVVSCLESEKLGCTDETKYSSLIQQRTDLAGKTPMISFNSPSKTGTWYISSYVKDYKATTLKSKAVSITKGLDLAVSIPTTNFINQDITVTYRATDGDTGAQLVPNMDIYLTMNGNPIAYTPAGVNGFKFKVNAVGTVHYKIIGMYSGYSNDIEEGDIEIIHPSQIYTLKVDNEDISKLTEYRIDSGTHNIEISVVRGTEYLRIDTSNLRMRNPAQSSEEGSVLNFLRSNDNKYTSTYNFADKGRTYYLEGSYVVIESGEVINIEKPINIAGSASGGGDEPVFDPLILYGIGGLFVVALVTTIVIVKLRRRK
jgi:Mg-chelatase subunit ChlD